jgi:tetratricopeptide (TPR) repeat protein
MQRRFRAALLVVVAGLSLSLVACGQVNKLKARKAFKEGTAFYTQQEYKRAAEKYQETVDLDPDYETAYFYLANSYDNQFKPSRRGEAQNDEYLNKAIQYYKVASERSVDTKLKKLSLEYLVAAYGADKLADPGQAEPIVKRMIELDPQDPANYFILAKMYEDAGEYDQAEETLLKAKEIRPNDPQVYLQMARYYNAQGEFEKTIEAFNERARLEPTNPEAFYTLSSFYWDKTFRDARLTEQQKRDFVAKGLDAVDKALQLRPDYQDALISKGLLIRVLASLEKDRAKYDVYMKEAQQYSDKANELRKKKAAGIQ